MDPASSAPVGDDRKPSPVAHHRSTGPTKSLSSPEASMKPVVKRKRRSPEKPWKKPKDMPKRPLSAYNLFFRDERERLLSSGPGGDKKTDDSDAAASGPKGKGKRSKKTSGIGFANLAKTIAARWKELDNQVKAPYEKIAAAEKKVYDEAVAGWRIEQKVKKKALAAEKKAAEESRMVAMREGPMAPNLFSSERSLGSFSDTSNPYPSEWFHANQEEGDVSERSGQGRGSIPPIVDASATAGCDAASAWGSQGRHDAYYHQRYGTSDEHQQYHQRYTQQRHSSQHQQQTEYSRGGYNIQSNLFSYDTSAQAQHQAYRDYYQSYRDYYNQQPQGTDQASGMPYQQHRHHGDMRMSRDSQQPQQHEAHAYGDARSSEMAAYHAHHAQQQEQHQHHQHHQYHHPSHQHHPRGRSASMPPVPGVSEHGNERVLDESFRSEPGGYVRASAADEASRPPRMFPADNVPPINPVDSEVDPVDETFPSLNETLDEDAISFITSMKYS